MKKIDYLRHAIRDCEWTPSACGRQYFDASLISIDTLYFPEDYTAAVGFVVPHKDGATDDIYESKSYIKGTSEEDCKMKVKRWYLRNLEKVLKLLLDGE